MSLNRVFAQCIMAPQSSQKEELVYWHNTICYYGVKALTLHFEGQQSYTSTSFTFAGKQLHVTALLYFKLSLHPIHVKSTLCYWRDNRLLTNAKLYSETCSYFARQLRTVCQVKYLDRWHMKSFTIRCFQTHIYDMKVKAGLMWFILSTTIETFVIAIVKVKCQGPVPVLSHTFADVWSIPVYDQFIFFKYFFLVEVLDPPATADFTNIF